MAIPREQLFEELWAEPATTVAARYGVSSTFLARVCEDLRIPRPSRGYWAQLRVGKAPERPNLPDPEPGDLLEWARGDDVARRQPRPEPSSVATPSRITDPVATPAEQHSLLVGVREEFQHTRDVGEAQHLRPFKKLLPDILVSHALLDSALQVANALFAQLAQHGHRVMYAPKDESFSRPELDFRDKPEGALYEYRRWSPARPTVTYIGTVAIGLTLYELSEHVDVYSVKHGYARLDVLPTEQQRRIRNRQWIHAQDMPSGRLCLRAYSPYSQTTWSTDWRESAAGEWLSQLPTIERGLRRHATTVATLAAEARAQIERERERWREQRRVWEAEQAEQQRQELSRQRDAARRASYEALLAIIDAWAQARHIATFLDEIASTTHTLPAEDQAAIAERVAAAKVLLGTTDPLARLRDWQPPPSD